MGNGGVLAFTLGVSASPLIRGLSQGGRALGSFLGTAAKLTGVTALIGTAFESVKQSANLVQGVFEAITRGSDLQRLHARTGETVQDLFLLQKGFKAAGLDSDSLGQMIFHLQKSMTGINDVGEDTNLVFSILGLQMAQIRQMNAPDQFQAIAKAMAGMNSSQAAGLAGKLFGREGAANFLQLARSSDQFSAALRDNVTAAAQMARNAAAFENIELSIGKIKEKTQNLFAGLAEGAAPGIQKVLDLLNKIDLSGIGLKFGHVIAAFAQAIQDGQIGKLLELSLEAGLTGFQNMFMALIDGINAAMQKLFLNLVDHADVVKRFALGNVKASEGMVLAAVGGVRAAFGSSAGYDQFEAGKRMIGHGLGNELGAGGQATEGTGKAFAKAFADSLKNAPNQSLKDFMALLHRETGRAGLPGAAEAANRAAAMASGPAKNFDPTSLEKMGFVFGRGGPTIIADHARTTAEATKETARNTALLVAVMRPQMSINPALRSLLNMGNIVI